MKLALQPDKIDSLDDDLKPLMLAVLRRSEALAEENKALRARIAELEAKRGTPPKTPDNSSLPPSRGQKAKAEPRAKQRRKSRPGVRADSEAGPMSSAPTQRAVTRSLDRAFGASGAAAPYESR